jgi:cell division transport system ATP-binding protein
VYFDGQDVARLRPHQLPYLRRRIGVVFQDFRLLPKKTAYENVAFAMEAAGYPEKDIKRDVPEVLELVGIADRARNFPHELSGGEKQRVAIARALVQRPDVITADEPTGNLDPINAWEILRLLVKINEYGTAVILATHNKDLVDAVGRRVVLLDRGKVISDEEKGKYVLA